MPWTNLEGAARLLVICITVLLVAAGMCGVQLLIVSGSGNESLTGFFFITGLFELGAMVLSFFVGLIALLVWIWSLLAEK